MVIGLAPFSFINNDIEANLAQMERGLRLAQGRADLLCFGEAFLQGFDAMNWDYAHDRSVAVTRDSPEIRQLCRMTKQYSVDLLFGYLEREGERLYSSCMLIENGSILHNYRRVSRGWKEYWSTDEHYCEGDTVTDFLYKGQAFRIALCGDLWDHPERFQTDGILLWPVYVNFSLPEWEKYEPEYAQQAGLAACRTLLVNSITREPVSIGGAFFYENGSITAKLPFSTEQILYITL